jgi:ATP-dependent helicase/nuclease subunit A
MTSRFVVPAETTDRQRRASAPTGSAWVSANAGSGKTWVLARRVIRLLLGGTAPSRILCLTFTKAAAATMSNRVFAELGRWTLLDDAALAGEISDIEGGRPEAVSPTRLARARRLFAEAIETPGGLKIQTIHAFCERILQQFPLEAGLSGRFEILDEVGERDLVAAARDAELVALSSAADGSPDAGAFAELLGIAGEAALGSAIAAVVSARDDLRDAIRAFGSTERVIDAVRRALGVAEGETDERLVAEMLVSPDFPPALVAGLIADLEASTKSTDRDQAKRMRLAGSPVPPKERLAAWWSVFFTGGGTARANVVTKDIRTAHPDLVDRIGGETARLQRLADARAGLAALSRTALLLAVGDRIVGRYETAKNRRGALDFADLVGRTADLLAHADAAAWVQYKLDKGIDHVLVDEAQDTNPRQWAIVHGLTGEFFAGESARPSLRTVFAVGDEKQSIYSFQGAEPARFAENRRRFAMLAAGVDHPFADVQLNLSFRSTGDVLAAVDRVFAAPALRARLLSDPSDYGTHAAARAGAPGLVEIWPEVAAVKEPEPEEWDAPLDRPTAASPISLLSGRIADEIARLLGPDVRLEGTGARIRPRDVIVLVRKRGPFVDAINRVLKERGLPVAGHDRMRLADHVAVADLAALGRALTLVDDDLSLAAALKSPLFGCDDDDLVELTTRDEAGRSGLAAALAAAAASSERWAAIADRLDRWREAAARLPPFEFFVRVLSADGGRRRFAARLGSEVEDVLDEFLALAAAHDRGPAPSLVRFLAGLDEDTPEIKRELDGTRDEIRVMTVHGAKGLEAAVVFLVDPGSAPTHPSHDPVLVRLAVPDAPPGAPPVPVWSRGSLDPACLQAARGRARAAAGDEYLRLLYVAMTRAADRLYLCCHCGSDGPADDAWYRLVSNALLPDAEPVVDAAGAVVAHRWRAGPATPHPPVADTAATAAAEPALPAWIDRAPPMTPPARRLRPSAGLPADAGVAGRVPVDAAALEARRLDRLRGTLAHRLLERLPDLPAEDRAAAATRFLAHRGSELSAELRDRLAGEVARVLADPVFAAVFGPGSRAEVPIVGRLVGRDGAPIEVAGRIDRLVIGPDEILVVDFKTDPAPPSGPSPGQIGQLAVYAALLGRLHPGRRIRAAILWTALPRFDEIAADRLAAAVDGIAAT